RPAPGPSCVREPTCVHLVLVVPVSVNQTDKADASTFALQNQLDRPVSGCHFGNHVHSPNLPLVKLTAALPSPSVEALHCRAAATTTLWQNCICALRVSLPNDGTAFA